MSLKTFVVLLSVTNFNYSKLHVEKRKLELKGNSKKKYNFHLTFENT